MKKLIYEHPIILLIAGIAAAFLFSEVPAGLQILGDVIVLAGVVYLSVIEVNAGKQ